MACYKNWRRLAMMMILNCKNTFSKYFVCVWRKRWKSENKCLILLIGNEHCVSLLKDQNSSTCSKFKNVSKETQCFYKSILNFESFR